MHKDQEIQDLYHLFQDNLNIEELLTKVYHLKEGQVEHFKENKVCHQKQKGPKK